MGNRIRMRLVLLTAALFALGFAVPTAVARAAEGGPFADAIPRICCDASGYCSDCGINCAPTCYTGYCCYN